MEQAKDHQLTLQLGGSSVVSVVRTTRKKNRSRSLPVIQPQLLVDKFNPVEGVPESRAACPTQRPCPRVRCRWHLFMEDAEHRAGRPGLSSVKRNARGHTLSEPGTAGHKRAGTTLRPAWLELERHCKGWIEVDDAGQLAAINVDEQQWDGMKLQPGEPLRVVSYDGSYAAGASVVAGSIRLDRAPPFMTVAILITRVRGVPSCALDEIAKYGKPMTNEQTGDALGRHRTLIAREVKRALGKAKRAAAEMGMTEQDLLRGLRELGAG